MSRFISTSAGPHQYVPRENPAVWTDEFEADIDDLIPEAVALESTYAEEACPPDLLGMSAEGFVEYVEYITARRLTQLGIDEAYGTENPFPWTSAAVDRNREMNFFERQVTKYQSSGSLDW